MHIKTDVLRLLLLTSFLASGSALAAPAPRSTESVPDEVLVAIRPGTGASAVAALHQSIDADKADRLAEVKSGTIWRLHSRSKNTAALVKALEHNPNVAYAEPNYIIRPGAVPNDTKYSQLWALRNVGQTIDYNGHGISGIDIDAEAAWGVTTGSASIVIGVVDMGVDYTHPDLAPNIWSNPGGIGNSGCAAGTHGFDAITRTCDPKPVNSYEYHGTHVAGTIGAVGNNALGVTGVNWTTTIMPLRFMNDGGGSSGDAIAAIDFAIQAKIEGVNVRVLNNSWGSEVFSRALLDEILKTNEHGILFVASAGNDESNVELWPHYPSGYASPNIIAVAATDYLDRLAWFSNFGPNTVHLGAPGTDILSTVPNGGYDWLSGTSMAAPHVTGVAALLLSKSPNLTTVEVKQAILSGVDPIPALAGKTITGGRLNAAKVLGVPPGPDFTLSMSPSTVTMIRGESASVAISIAPSGGLSDPVQLSASDLPYGATATFDPNPATTSSTLTLSAISNYYYPYTWMVTIGAGNSQAGHSYLLPVTVIDAPPEMVCPDFRLHYLPNWYGEPTGITTGDFDRNGTPDIAYVSANSATTVSLLGSGDGSFTIGSNLVGGNAPVAVATADFNRDGKLDLAIANAGGSQVSVHLGLGNGSFSAATQFQSGSNPFAIATGDFDADGRIDLAVANNGSSNVSILRGLGDGSFAAPASYAVGSGPHWIAAGDLNRDGRLDLAVAVFNANQVVVLLGNGNGSFQPGVSYVAGSRTSSVALGDVDGDSTVDLVATGNGSNDVSVLTGHGDGTFRPAIAYPVGKGPSSVAIVDVDDNGHPDLAVSNEDASTVTVLVGHGDGSFGSPSSWWMQAYPSQIVAADVDRNGAADLIVAPAGTPYLKILQNAGACSTNCGTLDSSATYPVGSVPDGIATGDFNADGATDIVTANRGSNDVSITLGSGDGTLQAPTSYAAGSAPRAVQVADLDGDGRPDLAVANENSNDVSILLGNPDGSFDPAITYATGNAPRAITIGDLNRDGRIDLAVANSGSDDVSILIGSGSGTFSPAAGLACGDSPRAVVVADFDRDGIVDLAVANFGSNDVTLFRGNGDATFQTGSPVATGNAPVAMIAEDFNRDGMIDLATANSGSSDAAILLGSASGEFAEATFFATGTNPSSLVATDVDDDGILDLAVAGSADLTLLRGTGNGTFVASIIGPLPQAGGIAACDLDGDGSADLAVSGESNNAITVVINSCPAPDLAITASHDAPFRQGDTGKHITITVSNAGRLASSGLVGVSETLPRGIYATSIAGAGWDCALTTLKCLRSDSLSAGSSYPPVTVTVNVANTAGPTLTATAAVMGGGEFDKSNDSVADVVTVVQLSDLLIEMTQTGPFAQGESGQKYRINVRNAGGAATSGTISVTDTLPSGLTATAIGGAGWTCTLGALSCSRSDALGSGANYPTITLTVNVAANAPAEVVNIASVSGGGELNLANNSAVSRTIVWSSTACHQYGSGVAYPLGEGWEIDAVAVGDFNGDAILDVVGTPSYDGIEVLIGRGSGDFEPAVRYFDGYDFSSLTPVDLDRDGALDLVAISSNSLFALMGAGDGTFVLGSTRAVSNPRGVAAGDFNGDGFPDLAVRLHSGTKLALFIGIGDGSMLAPFDVETLVEPHDLVSGDFDGDRIIDLAVSSTYHAKVQFLRGTGDGTFLSPVTYAVASRLGEFAVGDLDDDNDLDLVVSYEEDHDWKIGVMLARGDGTMMPLTALPGSPYQSASQLLIEDMTSDGKADIVVRTSYIALHQGNGDGTFLPSTTLLNSNHLGTVLVSDLDRDGSADLVTGYGSNVYTYLGSCVDLAITKSHTGTFHQGQTATYTIVATNPGTRPSRGAITVKDTLPDPLVATAMSGAGWTCDVASTTCTRGDALAPGAQFPPITLTVNVPIGSPSGVTNVAYLSGGGESSSTNNTANDYASIPAREDMTVMLYAPSGFAAGSTGASYYAYVYNAGGEPTSGSVTFSIAVAPGLTLTGLSGTGWNCSTASASCTRSDLLPAGPAYYPIVWAYVNVAEDCPSSVTTVATVSGGGDTSPDNNTSTNTNWVLTRPANFVARASGATSAQLTWSAVPLATGYSIERSTANGTFNPLASIEVTSYTDTTLASNELYRYRVRAEFYQAAVSAYSLVDSVLTSLAFTDDPVVAGSTIVKGVHLIELRNAVGRMRSAAGLAPASWTDPTMAGTPIKAIHVTELRTRLNEARVALGMPVQTFTDPTLSPGMHLKAAHIQELRESVK